MITILEIGYVEHFIVVRALLPITLFISIIVVVLSVFANISRTVIDFVFDVE